MASRFSHQLSISLAFTFILTTFSFTENEELASLLRFKTSIVDPKNFLSDWSNTSSSSHHCNWTGITCTRAPTLYISSINLQSLNLSGEITDSVCNLPYLTHLDLSHNFFNQPIPLHLSRCLTLETLNLSDNLIWGTIPVQISEFTSLKVLDFSFNHVQGKIPEELGLLFNLNVVNFRSNLLSGFVPTSIGNLSEITVLDLSENKLFGSLPNSISQCLSLERFEVQHNGFSGEFPIGLWSLPKIKILRLDNNRFTSGLPYSVALASSLEQVVIDNNSFTGEIPKGFGLIKSLYKFSASENGFSGELPLNFFDSPVLSIVNISHNNLSGKIPELKKCEKLVSLSLAGNAFTGEIPRSLGGLNVLTYLDISDNKLTGLIPKELENLKLALFNVSFNRLSGEVSQSLVSGLPASFLQGNPGLCGPGLTKSCSKHRSSFYKALLLVLICLVISLTASLAVSYRYYYRKNFQYKPTWQSEFYYPLKLTDNELMKLMNESVLSLSSGELVAVKKLVNPRNVSLKDRVRIIAKIRHKNVIRILGFCYTDEFIFLIYEFMENGNLHDMLLRDSKGLEWSVRLKIALGVARGLVYISKDYVPHLLHRNLKSTNILLDKDLEPKLTDFALDQIVGEDAFQSTNSCYTAPESNYSKKATEEMDVYSFGVVLLELLTGESAEKGEEEGEYGESVDIVKQVRRKINLTDGAIQVLDQKILSSSCREEMLKTLDIALDCIAVVAEKRPSMVQVIKALEGIISSSASTCTT